ncbi:hypothetical protein SAMN02745164_02278 [Marinitoga hydrogenitolerans DSM 16785]|uniref:DUF1868 domain-containing protein n=1 Tax=Marinitoga hydrogenitolerans (strain DSM 16785 / JCM 12826 / AT1271) TaxID=1122195 RepID=A0A1M5AWG9_MARH1|nr:hypothetical protein [Marinitoga hydrogenitolerans]SHF34565.1 hypothetical protein SAMN02745164_02278 [Marinitoga hydrogenitolerans DSM 16785]
MYYKEYIKLLKDINANSKKNLLNGDWENNEGIYKKVDKNGYYIPFSGNTVLIFLNYEERNKLQEIQKKLYSKIGYLLAEPLKPETFHITIHDLCNPFNSEDINLCMKETEEKIKNIFINDFTHLKPISICFNSIGLFHGNSAIGVEFMPSSKKDFTYLMYIYNKIDSLFPLNATLIPHVTLGYYKPIYYSKEDRKKILETISNIKFDINIKLDLSKLTLQKFNNMNEYLEIYTIISNI